MVSVKAGRTGEALTMPFGPLRLMDMAHNGAEDARRLVDKGLANTRLSAQDHRVLYAVGGIWRSFARVDMDQSKYSLHVLQNYSIPRARALRLCAVLAKLGRKSLDLMRIVSKRRVEMLPYGAIVLERLLLATDGR